jgi:hypothetical protein
MAPDMSRKDKFVFQLFLLLAVGTFLFGIWALVGGLAKPGTSPAPPPLKETNGATVPPADPSPRN